MTLRGFGAISQGLRLGSSHGIAGLIIAERRLLGVHCLTVVVTVHGFLGML